MSRCTTFELRCTFFFCIDFNSFSSKTFYSRCYNCGGTGHLAVGCPSPFGSIKSGYFPIFLQITRNRYLTHPSSGVRCRECDGYGHIAAQCPNRLSRNVCYKCGRYGHQAKHCSERPFYEREGYRSPYGRPTYRYPPSQQVSVITRFHSFQGYSYPGPTSAYPQDYGYVPQAAMPPPSYANPYPSSSYANPYPATASYPSQSQPVAPLSHDPSQAAIETEKAKQSAVQSQGYSQPQSQQQSFTGASQSTQYPDYYQQSTQRSYEYQSYV